MPYVKKIQRPKIDAALKNLLIMDEGELNYAACNLFIRFIDSQEGAISYKKIQAGIAALEFAAHEIKVRVLRGYEKQKIIENGDIFQDFIKRHNVREYS